MWTIQARALLRTVAPQSESPQSVSNARGCAHQSSLLNSLKLSHSSCVLCAGRQVMEPDQIDILAGAVCGGAQQIPHAVESRFTSKVRRDVVKRDLLDRVDYDVAFFHLV